MRITLGALVTRLTVLAGIALGAFAATRHVTGRPLDAVTSAACVAHLPGMSARCASDRFVAHTGPFLGPALVGALGGLVLAVVLVTVAASVLRAAGRPRRTALR